MSSENAVSQTNAAAAAQDPAITPEEMVIQLRALREQIPSYVQLSVPEALALRTVASLHPDFAQAAINAVGASPRVEATVGQTAEELQADAEAAARWSKVEDELRAMLQGVTSANLTRRHRLGQAVLLTYVVSKKLVLLPEHANLLPHLANMRRANRLGRNRKSLPQTPAPAPPAPVPTPHV